MPHVHTPSRSLPGRLGLAAVTAVAILAAPPPAAAEPLRTAVRWTDTAGAEGTADFEGLHDGETLTGRLVLGAEMLVVQGTVDEAGAVSGTVTTAGGAPVLSFETTLVAGELSGDFTVTGATGGAWLSDSRPPPAGIPNVPDR